MELTIPDDYMIWLDAAETREVMKVTYLEQVLLTVAWVSDAERCLFQLSPKVTFWDTAQKTNCEKRHLFLACGKDRKNSSFNYLPAFMPSESM
jgi:hypothetical protein